MCDARYALLTNGLEILLADLKADFTISRNTFPSPVELSFEAPALDQTVSFAGEPDMQLNPVFDYPELVKRISDVGSGTLILDHTLPWGMRMPSDPHLVVPEAFKNTTRADLIPALLSKVASRPNQGVTIALVYPAICSNSEFQKLRMFLSKRTRLSALLELPPDVFLPLTSIRPSIVRLASKKTEEQQPTYLYSFPSRGDLIDVSGQMWLSDVRSGLMGRKTRGGFFDEISPGAVWTVGAHHPRLKEIENGIASLASLQVLGEFCDVFQGVRHPREEAIHGKGVPIFRGRDVSAGVPSKEQVTQFRMSSPPSEKYAVKAGDILLQRVGSTPSCVVASRDLEGVFASDTIFVIRPRTTEVSSFLISQFLSSAVGQTLLRGGIMGSGAPTISLAYLSKLAIPILPQVVSNDLDELQKLEQQLQGTAEKLRSLRLGVFDSKSKEEFDSRLVEARQSSRSLAEGIRQAGTLEAQIRNFFPYPIAFAYRILAAHTVFSDLYREQLRLGENILAFLGSISLAVIRPLDRKTSVIDLGVWRGGISPGHWKTLIQNSAGVLATYSDNRLAQSLSKLWNKKHRKSFEGAVDSIIQAKNNFKHDRGPQTEEEFRTATLKTEQELLTVLGHLIFFAEHPIRLVRDIDTVRGTSTSVLTTLRCMGDHPGYAQEIVNYPTSVTKNDLYVEIESDRWVSLYPFLIPRDCPTCKTREIYFVDKWQGKGDVAILKSFERGHNLKDAEIGTALESWST